MEMKEFSRFRSFQGFLYIGRYSKVSGRSEIREICVEYSILGTLVSL